MGRLIYLVRHGETTGESSIRFWGRHDVPLSDFGREQVAGLCTWVQHVSFRSVIHSPLSRARESAEILLRSLHEQPLTVEQAPDLREVDFGDMEGLTMQEIAAQFPEFYAEWQAGRAKCYPNGESLAGFHERVTGAFLRILADHPEGNLLVVAHKGILKRAMAQLLDLNEAVAARLDLDLASLSVLRQEPKKGCTLRHLNLTAQF